METLVTSCRRTAIERYRERYWLRDVSLDDATIIEAEPFIVIRGYPLKVHIVRYADLKCKYGIAEEEANRVIQQWKSFKPTNHFLSAPWFGEIFKPILNYMKKVQAMPEPEQYEEAFKIIRERSENPIGDTYISSLEELIFSSPRQGCINLKMGFRTIEEGLERLYSFWQDIGDDAEKIKSFKERAEESYSQACDRQLSYLLRVIDGF